MRRLLLGFFLLFAAIAQAEVVDVTNRYLTNAGFDSSASWQTANVASSGTANSLSVDGWESNGGAAWSCSAAFGFGGDGQINGAAVPATGSDGSATGGALGISTGWGGACKYTQDVTLPAGRYRISYAAYNATASVYQNRNLIGFESDKITKYGNYHTFAAQTWITDEIYLNITEETTGKISVGLQGISGGSGANAKIFIDYVKIEAYNAAESLMPTGTVTSGEWTGSNGSYQGTYPEYYSGAHFTGDAMSNTTTLDNGNYDVDVIFHSHQAWIGQAAADGTPNSYITMAGKTLPVGILNNTGFASHEPVTYQFGNLSITDGSLVIKVGNSANGGNWLTVGGPTITKLGTPYVSYGAFDLPSTNVTGGFWYAYNIPIGGKYKITSSVATTLRYTQDATALITDGTALNLTAGTASAAITLEQGTIYLSSSAAATLSLAASSYSYETGTATVDVTCVQGGETVTVSYPNAGTNDPDMALSINTSGVTFGGNTVACTPTEKGFIFVVPTVSQDSSYDLKLPAGVAYYGSHVSSAAQTISVKTAPVFDGTYYLCNEDGRYLSRGSSWGTRAIVDDWGVPLEVATDASGVTTLKFIDSGAYLYSTDANIWCDNGDPSNQSTHWNVTLADGKYRLSSISQVDKYVTKVAGTDDINSDGTDATNILNWTFEVPTTHATKMETLRNSLTALSSQVSKMSSKTYVEATTTKTAEEYQGSSCAGAGTAIVSGSIAVYPGIYKFSIPAFHRTAVNEVGYPRHTAGTESVPVYAFFGDAKVQLHSVYDASSTGTDGCYTPDETTYYPNSQSAALAAFKEGKYANTIWVRVEEATTLAYGIQNQGRPGTNGRWTCYASDGIEITRYYDPTTEALSDGDDLTTLIVNPTIISTNEAQVPSGWSGNTSSWRWTQGTDDNVMECWNGSAAGVNFNMYQTLTGLQEGVYELSADMFNSSNSDDLAAAFTGGECGLYASTASANAYVGVTDDGTELTKHSLYIYVKEGENLTIGVKNVATPTARWFACDNFTLKYRTLASAKTDLLASIPDGKANNDLKSAMNSASTTLRSTTSADNFNALTTAIANVRVSAANYGHLKYALDNPDTRVAGTSDAVQTEYATIKASYQTYYDNQTASGTCDNEIHLVKAALAQALVNKKESLTALIVNNSFETGDATGWTVTYGDDTGVKANGGGYGTDGCDGSYLFNTWAGGDLGGYPLRQNIGWMPAGTYRLTSLVTTSAGTVYLLCNNFNSAGTASSDKTTFLNGSLVFTLDKLSEVIIGVAGGDASGLYTGESYCWYKADNFQLSTVTTADAEEEEEVGGIRVKANSYYARGSEDIFGRFSITGISATPTEQGLCYSTVNKEPTIADSKTTEYLSYSGKMFHISGLTPSTGYYVRPYAKINGVMYYGDTHKVYTIPRGTITYGIRTSDDTTADANITAAVKTNVEYWNRYTSIKGYYINAGYNSGVPTAECSYGGYISFGSNTSYQQCGTSMHENLHGIGMGTTSQWSSLGSGKTWAGPRINEFIKFFENSDGATMYGDSQHAWCSNSVGGLSYTINGAHEDKYSDLQRTANSLLAQAYGEDGLKPTSGSYCFAPYYSIEQEDDDVFYIQNSSTGKYLVDSNGTLGVQSYGSLDDADAAGIATWRLTFDPTTQWYNIINVKYGHKLSHYNYAWGLNKTDANINIVKSINSGMYWLNTPTSDGRSLLGNLSCGNTGLLDTTDANAQDWKIFKVVSSVLLGDVNKSGEVTISDIGCIIDILNGNTTSSKYDYKAADADRSGVINEGDVKVIRNMILDK